MQNCQCFKEYPWQVVEAQSVVERRENFHLEEIGKISWRRRDLSLTLGIVELLPADTCCVLVSSGCVTKHHA